MIKIKKTLKTLESIRKREIEKKISDKIEKVIQKMQKEAIENAESFIEYFVKRVMEEVVIAEDFEEFLEDHYFDFDIDIEDKKEAISSKGFIKDFDTHQIIDLIKADYYHFMIVERYIDTKTIRTVQIYEETDKYYIVLTFRMCRVRSDYFS